MKILPYMDTFTVFIVLTLVLTLGNMTVGTVTAVVAGFAAFLPPPLANNTAAGIVFLALLGTVILKLLDAPPRLGSGRRFKSLRGKLKRQGGVRNPSALAASIGRKKYGKERFQRLARHGKQP